ncbi:MAG: hypothetical protein WBL85_09145 [Sedimentisphaerales bacterium]
MTKLLKTIEYKGEKYEIMMIRKRGSTYLQDFKNGKPFSPFVCGITDAAYDLSMSVGCQAVEDVLLSWVEESVHIWVDNKDKFQKSGG